MKKLFVLISFLLIGIFIATASEKPELKWKKIEQGITDAKKAKKKILLDFYTDWCKWCKKLDEEVYGNDKVAEYLDSQYILVKLNPELNEKFTYQGKKTTGADFAQSLGVSGYPTIFFLESDGKPIDKLGGFVTADRFLPILKFIGEDYYKKMTWQEYMSKNTSSGKK